MKLEKIIDIHWIYANTSSSVNVENANERVKMFDSIAKPTCRCVSSRSLVECACRMRFMHNKRRRRRRMYTNKSSVPRAIDVAPTVSFW